MIAFASNTRYRTHDVKISGYKHRSGIILPEGFELLQHGPEPIIEFRQSHFSVNVYTRFKGILGNGLQNRLIEALNKGRQVLGHEGETCGIVMSSILHQKVVTGRESVEDVDSCNRPGATLDDLPG